MDYCKHTHMHTQPPSHVSTHSHMPAQTPVYIFMFVNFPLVESVYYFCQYVIQSLFCKDMFFNRKNVILVSISISNGSEGNASKVAVSIFRQNILL